MVVCRLRKNREFQLNDDPTRDSLGERRFLAVDKALSGVEQSGVLNGAKTASSCSKDCSSSHNSHSVEQLDMGCESDDKVTNESSNQGCADHVCLPTSQLLSFHLEPMFLVFKMMSVYSAFGCRAMQRKTTAMLTSCRMT